MGWVGNWPGLGSTDIGVAEGWGGCAVGQCAGVGGGLGHLVDESGTKRGMGWGVDVESETLRFGWSYETTGDCQAHG
jgi:hypothetical protein